jgi:hypothetical protein
MQDNRSMSLKLLFAGSIGAMIGGAVVLIAGKTIPKAMSRIMSEMVSSMMREMGEEGYSPSEF